MLVATSVLGGGGGEDAENLRLPLGLMFPRLSCGASAPYPSVAEARAYPCTTQERALADSLRRRAVIGDPASVAARLCALARGTSADELIHQRECS